MITVLCGGVGAAKLLSGLVEVVDPRELTAVVNTGDDTELHGLYISPDLDTITYTLSGEVNPETGWGRSGETFMAMAELEAFGGGERSWFRLGDRDLATHLYRTGRLGEGATLSQVTSEIAARFGLRLRLLPMSNDPVRTVLEATDGTVLSFQEYFVKLRHDIAVRRVEFRGSESARPAPGVLEALEEATAIVIAPSNPIVSIGPLLSLGPLRSVLERRRRDVVAVSPIVGGVALKGPADRLLTELGHESSAVGVADVLCSVAATLVIDDVDRELAGPVSAAGMRPVVADTVMSDTKRAAALACVALGAAGGS